MPEHKLQSELSLFQTLFSHSLGSDALANTLIIAGLSMEEGSIESILFWGDVMTWSVLRKRKEEKKKEADNEPKQPTAAGPVCVNVTAAGQTGVALKVKRRCFQVWTCQPCCCRLAAPGATMWTWKQQVYTRFNVSFYNFTHRFCEASIKLLPIQHFSTAARIHPGSNTSFPFILHMAPSSRYNLLEKAKLALVIPKC